MKKLLLLLLVIPTISYSQSNEWTIAFQKTISPDFGEPIHLPDMGHNPDFDIDKIASYDVKQRVLVVVSDSLYKKIFSRYPVDSLPVIDFTKKELVMYSACGQCLAFCDHQHGNTNCHRNACSFMVEWFVRDKMVFDEKKQFGQVNKSGN